MKMLLAYLVVCQCVCVCGFVYVAVVVLPTRCRVFTFMCTFMFETESVEEKRIHSATAVVSFTARCIWCACACVFCGSDKRQCISRALLQIQTQCHAMASDFRIRIFHTSHLFTIEAHSANADKTHERTSRLNWFDKIVHFLWMRHCAVRGVTFLCTSSTRAPMTTEIITLDGWLAGRLVGRPGWMGCCYCVSAHYRYFPSTRAHGFMLSVALRTSRHQAATNTASVARTCVDYRSINYEAHCAHERS